MTRFILAAIIVLASSCSVAPEAIPNYDTVLFCEADDGCPGWVDDASVALQRYQRAYQKRLGRLPSVPETVTVRDHVWGGVDWEVLEGGRILGYTNFRDVVVVGRDLDTLDPVGPLDGAVFWHEVTHATLHEAFGEGDRDHTEGEGPWTSTHDELIRDLVAGVDLLY